MKNKKGHLNQDLKGTLRGHPDQPLVQDRNDKRRRSDSHQLNTTACRGHLSPFFNAKYLLFHFSSYPNDVFPNIWYFRRSPGNRSTVVWIWKSKLQSGEKQYFHFFLQPSDILCKGQRCITPKFCTIFKELCMQILF